MYHPPMPETTPQTFQNHTRFDIPYMIAIIVLAINAVSAIRTAMQPDHAQAIPPNILHVLVAFALVVIAFRARTNALKAQDRTIRLEERLRYPALLPAPLLARAESLTVPQIVALRFASDTELPGLVERTLTEQLVPKQIKQSITAWRPDHCRV